MQEEVENKTVTLVINSTKFSGRVLKSAISKYLAHRSAKHREKKMDKKAEKRAAQAQKAAAKGGYGYVVHHGKQSVKALIAQNQGVSNMDVSDKDLKGFEKIARKYNVDYAVRKTKGHPPKYLVFFRARDNDALIGAMEEYTRRKEYKKDHPSIIKRLSKSLAQSIQRGRDRVKERKKEQVR